MNTNLNLDYYKSIPVTDSYIKKKLGGKCNIILYRNLHKYTNIDQLFGGTYLGGPTPYRCCIILFESKEGYGHWVCLFKRDNIISFFDSYVGYPDDSLPKIDKNFRKISNQMEPILSKLMLGSNYKLEYNSTPLQEKNKKISTCGRWCILRILYWFLDEKEFNELINSYKNNVLKTSDDVVTYIVEFLI